MFITNDPYEFYKGFCNHGAIVHQYDERLRFSHPFRMVIEYDPERLRVKRDVFAPKEVVERYIQQVMGNVKD